MSTNNIITGYIEYFDELTRAIKSSKSDAKSNSDCGHNAMVFVSMLENTDNVNMVCGEMSAIRHSLYDHLRDDLIAEGTDQTIAQDAADWAKGRMSTALQSFVENAQKKLNIYVINYQEALLSQFINNEAVIKGIENGTINIYPLPEDFLHPELMPHIAKGDDTLVRIEDDNVHHSASVFVHPEKGMYESLNESYAYLHNRCKNRRITTSQLPTP